MRWGSRGEKAKRARRNIYLKEKKNERNITQP